MRLYNIFACVVVVAVVVCLPGVGRAACSEGCDPTIVDKIKTLREKARAADFKRTTDSFYKCRYPKFSKASGDFNNNLAGVQDPQSDECGGGGGGATNNQAVPSLLEPAQGKVPEIPTLYRDAASGLFQVIADKLGGALPSPRYFVEENEKGVMACAIQLARNSAQLQPAVYHPREMRLKNDRMLVPVALPGVGGMASGLTSLGGGDAMGKIMGLIPGQGMAQAISDPVKQAASEAMNNLDKTAKKTKLAGDDVLKSRKGEEPEDIGQDQPKQEPDSQSQGGCDQKKGWSKGTCQ